MWPIYFRTTLQIELFSTPGIVQVKKKKKMSRDIWSLGKARIKEV